jgi:hypothetical protein
MLRENVTDPLPRVSVENRFATVLAEFASELGIRDEFR